LKRLFRRINRPRRIKKKQKKINLQPPKTTTPNRKIIFLIKILVACQAQNCVAQKAANLLPDINVAL